MSNTIYYTVLEFCINLPSCTTLTLTSHVWILILSQTSSEGRKDRAQQCLSYQVAHWLLLKSSLMAMRLSCHCQRVSLRRWDKATKQIKQINKKRGETHQKWALCNLHMNCSSAHPWAFRIWKVLESGYNFTLYFLFSPLYLWCSNLVLLTPSLGRKKGTTCENCLKNLHCSHIISPCFPWKASFENETILKAHSSQTQ